MNRPVSFELAKLLKEKGFDIGFGNGQKFYFPDTKELTENYRGNNYPAPTISEVVMWLYEKHDVWIYVDSHEFSKWCYNYKFNRPHKLNVKLTENGQFGLDDYNSPTEAYEGAIEYTLNNLI